MYKNISKKILSFLFVFTLFFISLNSVKATTFTLKQNTDRLTDYTSSYTTRFWATNDGTSETTGANAFCIDPDNHTPAVLNNATTNGNIKTVSGVTSVPYNTASANHNIKLLLYYGIGGPGWARASQHWYNIVNSNDCSTSNVSSHAQECANGTYAKEHILLSLVDGACSGTKCSSYGCTSCRMSDTSCSSCPVRDEATQLLNALETLANQENLFDSSDNIPGFNVYIYNEEFSSGGQRIIYWTYEETPKKGYIEVTKNFTNKIGFSKTDNEMCQNNISFTADGQNMSYIGNCKWVYGLDSNNKPTLSANSSHEVVETTTNYGFNVLNGTTDITVNIGSHVLKNSFDSNDPMGFYQATLSLTESEI